ncbi:hypothetical protein V6S06_22530 [Aeromonas hydrophila]|uniref:Preprotein translocase subunit SecB n=1 Tax=Aeromonas veronii TaxID=654 RepID=A0AAN1URK1_AERVE|nr:MULTISPECIES: preprotein translocase subunit SecB [Aeromonas]MDD9308011.1 hypothetical protein [Aeromonas hydrophila]AYV39037.1 preprotein translocase subunit SecB [Aeromonas veronii]MBE8735947.1 preprotein translocase subunit SecB [Aeromonas veronii]MBE8738839.1 preprotein translocase subunit SecB [Aeromonas veronii]MBE8744790.1 preprotein translocase subunit SecB [Aeromonas veronii]
MAKVSKSLQQAIESLHIADVYLKATRAQSQDEFDPKFFDAQTELQVQQMHVVRRSEVIQIEGDGQLLRVYIRLGARWIMPREGDEPEVKAFVEGDYIAEYQMVVPLEQAAIDEFALKNASYHVWPYWREFLSSQCERLRLPRVVLPTTQFSRQ